MEYARESFFCESCESAPASFYLVNDKIFVCQQCDEKIVTSLSTEERISLRKEPVSLLQRLHELVREPPMDPTPYQRDLSSLLCYVEPSGIGGEAKIVCGPGLYDLTKNVRDPSDPVPIVSIVGPAGVGKSLVARMFSECPERISTASSHHHVRTADISVFRGKLFQDTGSDSHPFVVFDSEALNLQPDILPAEAALVSESPEAKLFTQRRREIIRVVHPKLLHLFSDILVYVHSGEIKQLGAEISRDLIDFANKALLRTKDSTFTRPSLIVILNRCSRFALEECRASPTRRLSMGTELESQLHLFFSDVAIIPIPCLQDDIISFLDNFNMISNILAEKIRDISRLKTDSAATTRALIGSSIGIMSINNDSSLDLRRLRLQNAVLEDSLSSYLFEWFYAMVTTMSLNIGYHLGFDEALENFRTQLPTVLRLHVARDEMLWNMFQDDLSGLLKHFEPVLESLERKISRYLPCYASTTVCGKELLCEVELAGHTSHRSQGETVVAWSGPYIQSPHHTSKLLEIQMGGSRQSESPRLVLDECTVKITSFWRELGIPRWSNRVCLACCTQPCYRTLEFCGHILCKLCSERESTTNMCPLCGFRRNPDPTENLPGPDTTSSVWPRALSFFGWLWSSEPQEPLQNRHLLDLPLKIGDLKLARWMHQVYPSASASCEALSHAAVNNLVEILEFALEAGIIEEHLDALETVASLKHAENSLEWIKNTKKNIK